MRYARDDGGVAGVRPLPGAFGRVGVVEWELAMRLGARCWYPSQKGMIVIQANAEDLTSCVHVVIMILWRGWPGCEGRPLLRIAYIVARVGGVR